MNDQNIIIPIKRFILVEQCPEDWKRYDLYLFRDEAVAFYVGQSHLAFTRVWEHLIGGFKGHSMMGRFVWSNWPTSMRFIIEFMCSQSEQFAFVENEINAAERHLIQQWSPCFNISLNSQPTPIPDCYRPANATLRGNRSLKRLQLQAEHVIKAEDDRLWVQEMDV